MRTQSPIRCPSGTVDASHLQILRSSNSTVTEERPLRWRNQRLKICHTLELSSSNFSSIIPSTTVPQLFDLENSTFRCDITHRFLQIDSDWRRNFWCSQYIVILLSLQEHSKTSSFRLTSRLSVLKDTLSAWIDSVVPIFHFFLPNTRTNW